MLYLANEGTVAVGIMAVAFTVALTGVGALLAYVIHCDRQNRLGDAALAGGGEAEPARLATAHEARVETHVMASDPTEPAVVTPPDAVGAGPEPGLPHRAPRPGRPRPPQGG